MLVDLTIWTYQALRKRKKLKKMDVTQENVEEVYYVWGKSEKAGVIVQEDPSKTDDNWMYFTDGTRCNRSLVNEYLLKTTSETEAKNISQSFGGLGNVNSTQTTPTQPKPVQENTTQTTPAPQQTEEVNVMMEMLKKMSAKNKAEMPVKVNIPSLEVYDLLKDQMDITKKDLNNQIGLLVESQIDSLRDQLKEQIESFIKSYYNEHRTNKSIDS